MTKTKTIIMTWIVIAILILLYYVILRQHVFRLENTKADVIVALILFIATVGALALSCISGIVAFVAHRSTQFAFTTLWGGLFSSSLLILMVVVSQMTAYTPEISGIKPIAELRRIEINGRVEWLSIRGEDSTKPIVLFLAGGPGGSHLATARYYFKPLESDYIVVTWEQPGAAKSFSAISAKDITLETYLEDGAAVAEYLCEKFKQPKIHVIGESWGAALGLMMVHQYPERYYSFIGTGQMIDFLETERIDYQMALDDARKNGEESLVSKLERQGPPPYSEGLMPKTLTYLSYLNGVMARTGKINGAPVSTMDGPYGVEYGLLDKVNFFWGLLRTFDSFYGKLYAVNLRERCPEMLVPVHVFHGRYDYNAPAQLVEDYIKNLKAPKKSLIYFEKSGHNPWQTENALFLDRAHKVFQDSESLE